MLLIPLLVGIVIQAWAWRRLQGRLATGAVTRPGAIGRYGAWAFAPFVGAALMLLGAIGAEEATGTAIIPEAVARSTPLVAAALGVVAAAGTLGFLVRCTVGGRGGGRGPTR